MDLDALEALFAIALHSLMMCPRWLCSHKAHQIRALRVTSGARWWSGGQVVSKIHLMWENESHGDHMNTDISDEAVHRWADPLGRSSKCG